MKKFWFLLRTELTTMLLLMECNLTTASEQRKDEADFKQISHCNFLQICEATQSRVLIAENGKNQGLYCEF